MRVAIPRRVKLRGRWWSVRLTSRKHKRREMHGLAGQCHRAKRTLWIDSRLSGRERELALVHEVLHAIFPVASVVGVDEEQVVLALEAPLLDAIRAGAFSLVPDEVP